MLFTSVELSERFMPKIEVAKLRGERITEGDEVLQSRLLSAGK